MGRNDEENDLTPEHNMKRLLNALGILEIFIALGALPAGYLFIAAPDGSRMGMTTEALAGSPFTSFLIPGLALFIFNGLFNVVNGILCFRRYPHAPWIGLMLGGGMLIWILVQVMVIGLNHFLQPAYFVFGLAEIIISILLIRKLK